MRKLFEWFLRFTFWLGFKFRYRIKVVGFDKIVKSQLKNPGGVLFLPNHPAALVDPCILASVVWHRFPLRPMIIEYMYYMPVVHGIMKFLRALPVPDFEASTNSLKRKRGEKVISELIHGLKNGENFLLYPAGRLKHTEIESIGGASATHRIIQEAPEANIVLVRTKGLWGSSFSRALTGSVPPLFPTLYQGLKNTFKNLIFFTPRRKVEIEFTLLPEDFPYHASRREMNRWLENWYNKPDGFSKQEGELPGDSLMLVRPSIWSRALPSRYVAKEEKQIPVRLESVDVEIQNKIFEKLSQLTEIRPEAIRPEMKLSTDLGLDSLDISELAAFLDDAFDVGVVPVVELTTVERVLGIASKQVKIDLQEEEEEQDLDAWEFKGDHFQTSYAHGKTISEVFLNNCIRMGKAPACADAKTGILSYPRLKIAVILLAEFVRTLPGKHVGVLLPASCAAYMSVLAIQLAGKVPVMINWTQGARHIKAVVELSGIEKVLTSWAFLERLDSVDLDGIEEMTVMLESVKREFSLFSKLKALYHSKFSTKRLLKYFNLQDQKEDDHAVLLFTSGTESMPKGVPLTHKNILENGRAVFESIGLRSDDVMLGMLPPFHAYGFSTSGLGGLLSGLRIAFTPNPTDGKQVAKAFEKWGTTVMSGAPSFIKGMIKAGTKKQFATLRICATGAEKAPPELFQLMGKIGKEQCLVEGYGLTECAPILTANRIGMPRKGVGAPLPGIELLVVDPETHEILPENTRGLILARGPNIFPGYINPGVASPFLMIEEKKWFNTGDLGILDEEGRLTIAGRMKRFVKAGGEMISLPAIEEDLLKIAPLKHWPLKEEGPTLAVLGKDQEGGKPVIKLVSTFQTNIDEVNQVLRELGFSNLVKITEVIYLEEIPLMGIGKVNYRQLEDRYLNEA